MLKKRSRNPKLLAFSIASTKDLDMGLDIMLLTAQPIYCEKLVFFFLLKEHSHIHTPLFSQGTFYENLIASQSTKYCNTRLKK